MAKTIARKTIAKGKAKAKKKSETRVIGPAATAFTGTLAQTISSTEIYHRLEWYFDRSHDPHGNHSIPPGTAIGLLLHGLGLQDLYVNINRASQTYMPAWTSLLFHGVVIPWVSSGGVAIGIKDVKNMGDLIDSLVLSYKHAGWRVI